MKRLFTTLVAGMAMLAMQATACASINVGFYSNNGFAVAHAQSVATGMGYNFVNLPDLSSLAGLDVLWAQNYNNGSQLSDLTTFSANVNAFVNGGGTFLYHDREVDNAESVLIGGGGFDIIRDFSDSTDIQVINGTTLVTNGPGGIIDNTTLDGGSSSSHGFAVSGSLPGSSVQILSRSNASEIVDFVYGSGAGHVYYSTIPLDYYFGGGQNDATGDAFRDIYGPNVLAFAGSLAVPEPGTMTIFATLGLAGIGMRRRRG